jgi:ribosome-associated heat shock protein Hsp15
MEKGTKQKGGEDLKGVRLDKWLWAARFFKTRSIAHAAIDAGKVHVDGSRAKPSRVVTVGQKLHISTPRGDFEVTVKSLSAQRVSASLAADLYQETDEGRQRREAIAEMHRVAQSVAPSERPTSHDRKLLRRLKEQH